MSAAIRYLIVDDENLSRTNLRFAVEEHSQWQLAGMATNVAQARLLLASGLASGHANEQIQVIFLDIQMPRESGLLLAQELALWSSPPLIIFVTAFNEHAIEAFRLHALDYLLKPLNDEHLKQAITRAEQMLTLQQSSNYAQALKQYVESLEKEQNEARHAEYWQSLSVRSVGRIDLVSLADVLLIEAQGNYMQLHLAEKKIMYRASMTQLERHLDPSVFIRTHRGYIVRIDQIASIQVNADHIYTAQLKCGEQVPISDRHITMIKNLFK